MCWLYNHSDPLHERRENQPSPFEGEASYQIIENSVIKTSCRRFVNPCGRGCLVLVLPSTSIQLGYQLLVFLFIGEVVGDNVICAKPSLSCGASITCSVLDDYAFWKKWIKLELVSNLPLILCLAYFFSQTCPFFSVLPRC